MGNLTPTEAELQGWEHPSVKVGGGFLKVNLRLKRSDQVKININSLVVPSTNLRDSFFKKICTSF